MSKQIRMMTKREAVSVVCYAAHGYPLTRTQFRRVQKALEALGITGEEAYTTLMDLEEIRRFHGNTPQQKKSVGAENVEVKF